MKTFVSAFAGVCNQCGRCCQYQAPDGTGLVRCAYLHVERHRTLDLVGIPGATRCTVHDVRFNGMPIPLHYVRGDQFYGWRSCAVNSPQEDTAIAGHVGRGCSLVPRDG